VERPSFEVDVRVVASTNKVPEKAASGSNLREDLYYGLNVLHIHLPRTPRGHPPHRRSPRRAEPQA